MSCRPGLLSTLLLAAFLFPAALAPAAGDDFILGADLSSLDELRAAGAVTKVAGAPVDAAAALRDAGLGWARLRLFHSPPDGREDLAGVVAQARELRARGFRILLDLHLSDRWADPANQDPPRAWHGLDLPTLGDSLRAYTRNVFRAHAAAGCAPDIVQLGNEIDGGLLWPSGYVPAEGEHPAFWDRLAALLKAGIAGLREAGGDSTRVLLHLARSGNADGCLRFCRELSRRGVDFDLLGLSYYPWWHGDMVTLRESLNRLSGGLDDERELIVVETAYPFTLRWGDGTHNLVGEEGQLHAGYAATPEGQAAYIADLKRLLEGVPAVRGLFYWEPAWISAPKLGSPWENCALFDFEGEVLPGLRALGRSEP